MAYGYRIVADENLLVITGSGTVTSGDIYDVVTAFQRDPDWRPTMSMLVDWREVVELDIETADLKRLAADVLDEEHMALGTPLGEKAAIVVSHAEHETIPILYAGHLRKSGLQTRVFHQLVPAMVWLGADPGVVEGR